MSAPITPDERAAMRERAERLHHYGGESQEASEDILAALDALDTAEAEVARLTARPAPAWDEEVVVAAVARAIALAGDYDGCFERLDAWADASDDARECGDVEEPMSTDAEDAEFWLSRARAAVAVVREHLPVRPDREAVARVLYENDLAHGRVGESWGDLLPETRTWYLDQADAVLDLWPGRSEAEVKAEAWAEGANAGYADGVYGRTGLDVTPNPYRLAATGGAS